MSFRVVGGGFFKGAMFFPYLINGIAMGFIFKFFYTRGYVLDSVLQWCGFNLDQLPYWLRDQSINNWSLVGTSIWRYLGQTMILFIGAIMSIDRSLFEAAEIDGANRFQQFIHIIGINHLCDMGFDVLTEAGYQPEIAYFEVFHELKMLVDLANEGGLNKARWSCSDTAQYGDYTSTVITEETKKRMQYQLKRIQDGSFAKEFMDDQAAGAPKFKELQEEYSHPHLETVGPKLRAMFSWNNQMDADADMAESFNGKIARTQVQ